MTSPKKKGESPKERKRKDERERWGRRRGRSPKVRFFLSALPAIIYARFRAVHG